MSAFTHTLHLAYHAVKEATQQLGKDAPRIDIENLALKILKQNLRG